MSSEKITVRCECSSVFRIPTKYAGKTVKCPNCGGGVKVPAAAPTRRRSRPDDEWEDDFDDYEAPPPRRSRSSTPAPARRKKTKSGWSPATIILVVVGGGVFLVFAACAGLAYVGFNRVKNVTVYEGQPDFGDASGLFPIDQIDVPTFANARAGGVISLPSGVRHHTVNWAGEQDNAGFEMTLRIYMPPGDHVPGSLPCVFVPPAGTNLMMGNSLDGSDYHDETEPYAKAGMIAVSYSLDGQCDIETATDTQFREAYLQFRAACAGVVNARNALEYVLANVPEVDSQRLFTAGHSSAGNVSILFAAHEPRLRACIAYAPAVDVESELAEVANDPAAAFVLPKIADFLKQSSPRTHISKLKAPMYLFHAMDDQNTPYGNTSNFANDLKQVGGQIEFVAAQSGGHYESMLRAIPGAIEWLKKQ